MAPRTLKSELSAKSYREPVENFSNGHKTNPQAKSAESTEAGDEVQPSHLWQPLELWETCYIIGRNSIVTHQIQWAPQRRCSQLRCPSCKRCSTIGPDDRVYSDREVLC